MVQAFPSSSAPRSLFPPSNLINYFFVSFIEEGKKKGILDDILLMSNQDDCNSYKHPMVWTVKKWSIHLEATYLI
ncbi:unnamed protein product [Musa textilis]